ncbi:hypothetical protein GGP62_003174 [Salinibacter ruber]|uniref:hypothetical protein n=1 Tax=Salinibacter ruber TaxID=146919 RepID=UPI002073073A|nr:hypothetical protein [Salinibacter ruber]MCS3708264.1 hypothetical protein [Salinibacter ruber]MCS4142757.1 hypothetical protein [Salinibacter ruber]
MHLSSSRLRRRGLSQPLIGINTLKRRAKEHRRSLNQEVLRVLEEEVAGSSESDRQAVRRACREEQERTPSWAITTREMKRMMREGLA